MRKRAEWSWIFYDWANSGFAVIVMTAFFPILFKQYLSAGVDPTMSTARLGFANSIAGLVIALLAPILGAISDNRSCKKKFLATFMFLGLVMTIALSFLSKGEWVLACVVYAVATIGFSGANSFYDSLLPSIASPKRVDYLSTAGFAWGYLGGGVLFTFNIIMYTKPEWFGLASGLEAVKWSFVTVAVWWAVFSIPLFLFVEEVEVEKKPMLKSISEGLAELKRTAINIKQYRSAVFFLIAFFLYNDGVGTTYKMAVDYGLSIGFQVSDLIKAILLVQFVGFPAALGFSYVAKILTPKKGIYICIAVYIFALLWGTSIKSTTEFYILASLIGLVQGGIQALSRSYYTRLFPDEKAGEFFGFMNVLGKFNGILGPLIMGWSALMFQSSRIGLMAVSALFVLGGIVLYLVPEPPAEYRDH